MFEYVLFRVNNLGSGGCSSNLIALSLHLSNDLRFLNPSFIRNTDGNINFICKECFVKNVECSLFRTNLQVLCLFQYPQLIELLVTHVGNTSFT